MVSIYEVCVCVCVSLDGERSFSTFDPRRSRSVLECVCVHQLAAITGAFVRPAKAASSELCPKVGATF